MKRFLLLSLILALTISLAHSYSLPNCETDKCQVCSSLGICVMCRQDYLLTINKETKTPQCIENTCSIQKCSRCLSEKICAQCETGYVLHSSGLCTKINEQIRSDESSVQSCLRRSLFGQCLECATDFVLEDGECHFKKLSLVSLANTVSCSSVVSNNCASCTVTPNFCTTCMNGYSISTTGTCVVCQTTAGLAIPNCQTCSSNNVCGVCQPGYSLTAGSCWQCNIVGCTACSANNYCTTCSPGYTTNPTNTGCVLTNCPPQCATCNALNQCLTCNSPFNPTPNSNGTCYTCAIPHCQTCDNFGCTKCFAPWVQSANGLCSYPASNPTCLSATAGYCNLCVQGYSANGGQCVLCPNSPICATCTFSTTTPVVATCASCIQGYYLSTTTTTTTTTTTCVACTYATCAQGACSTSNVCTSWAASTGLLAYTTTTSTPQLIFPYTCDIGCAQCVQNYPTACIQCTPGFFLQNNANTNNIPLCQPCGTNCTTCNPTTPSQCYTCLTNNYLNSNSQCVPCGTGLNCLTCDPANPTTTCLSCPYGYYLAASTSNQVTMTTCSNVCPANCLACYNPVTPINTLYCLACEAGFSLSSLGACLPCLANCKVCSGQYNQVCLECGSGYYLSTDRLTCTLCPQSHCSACNPSGCTACNTGYNLMTNGNNATVCTIACSFPCASCYAPNQCTSCVFGYTYNANNTCTLSQCVTSTVNGCQNCPLGSVLTNGACTACAKNCGRCSPSNTSLCVGCLAGSYLTGTTCTPCSLPCGTCSSPTNCLTCAFGYTAIATPIYSNQLLCQACVLPCKECTGNVEQCTSCVAGFTFTGWNCVSSFYYTFTASFAASRAVFYNHYPALISRLTYALQTTNNKALSIQYIQGSQATTAIQVFMTTIEQSDSKKAIAEYNNLKFALEQEEDNILAGMTVTSSSLGYRGGYIDTTYSNTSTLCGILIPLGILIVVAIAYFICSANNMDLPGYDSAPQDFSQSERGEATEMRTL